MLIPTAMSAATADPAASITNAISCVFISSPSMSTIPAKWPARKSVLLSRHTWVLRSST
jgi:hypothetical protein